MQASHMQVMAKPSLGRQNKNKNSYQSNGSAKHPYLHSVTQSQHEYSDVP